MKKKKTVFEKATLHSKKEKPLFLMSREKIKKKYGNDVCKKVGKGNIKEVLFKVITPKNLYI